MLKETGLTTRYVAKPALPVIGQADRIGRAGVGPPAFGNGQAALRPRPQPENAFGGLLSGLNEEERSLLAGRMISRTFPKNTVILHEADTANALYIIKKGRVNITKGNEDGKEIVIAMLSAGDFFGEMSLVDRAPMGTNVVTKEKCSVVVLRIQDLEPVLMVNPEVKLKVMGVLADRLRQAYSKIAHLALMDVYGRLTQLFLSLAKPLQGDLVISHALTHQEIANMIGSSREMVSRIVKDLVRGGYITTDKRVITIRNKLPAEW